MRLVLLLDLDGVLLDNRVWREEQRRLSGSAFSRLLGGEDLDWASHHPDLWEEVWFEGTKTYKEDRGLRCLNLARWWDRVHANWIVQLCEAVGIQPPESFEERVDLAERAKTFIYLNTTAIYEEAAEVIRVLSKTYELHMASGNPGWIVETVLDRLGVRGEVGKPFGCDLIGYQKGHERFYPAILEAIGRPPQDAVVVDDGESHLERASSLGLKTVRILENSDDASNADVVIGSISELPKALDRITST